MLSILFAKQDIEENVENTLKVKRRRCTKRGIGRGVLIFSQCLWLKLKLRANVRGSSRARFLSRSGQRVSRVMVDQRIKEEMNIIGCVPEFMLCRPPVLMGLVSDKVVYKVVTDPSCCYFARYFPAYPVWACHSGPCPSCLPGMI